MRIESNQIRTSVQTRKARIRIQPQESENEQKLINVRSFVMLVG
jgi:hypothetical protein